MKLLMQLNDHTLINLGSISDVELKDGVITVIMNSGSHIETPFISLESYTKWYDSSMEQLMADGAELAIKIGMEAARRLEEEEEEGGF